MQHKGTKILETERLLLRRWKESDAEEAFAHWMNDPDVTKYLTWAPHGDIEVTRSLLKLWERESAEPQTYKWALSVKNGILEEECIRAETPFGFFSRKDGQIHRFDLCEDCYDRLTKAFRIPIEIEERTEVL